MSIALVNQATGTASSGTTVTVTISTPTAGNCLVCTTGANVAANSVSGITGGGVTWSKVVASANQRDCELWIGVNSSGSGTTITITYTNTLGTAHANVAEFSGVALTLAAAVDTSISNFGTTASVATLSINTTSSSELLVGCVRMGTAGALTAGPTNSFIALNTPSSAGFQAAYQIVSVVGSYSIGWTWNGASWAWDTELAGLRGSSIDIKLVKRVLRPHPFSPGRAR